jgi:mRNA interferase RelE/StbE
VKWAVEISPEARRHLKKLGPSATAKVVSYVNKRLVGASDPRTFGKPLSGALKGLWRYRVEDYRILCRIEDSRVVVVIVAVGHRSGVYE